MPWNADTTVDKKPKYKQKPGGRGNPPVVSPPPYVGGGGNQNNPWWHQMTPWNDEWLSNTFQNNPWMGGALGGLAGYGLGSMFGMPGMGGWLGGPSGGQWGAGLGGALGGRLAGPQTNLNDTPLSRLTPWNDQGL